MARYIDADEFWTSLACCPSLEWDTIFTMLQDRAERSGDIKAIVHAHWYWLSYDATPGIGNWHCSNCDGISNTTTAYCGCCGARMDEVKPYD